MTFARTAASRHLSQIADMSDTDFALVSALEDLEADKVEGMSLTGRIEEISTPDPRSSCAVTDS